MKSANSVKFHVNTDELVIMYILYSIYENKWLKKIKLLVLQKRLCNTDSKIASGIITEYGSKTYQGIADDRSSAACQQTP